MSGTPTLPPVLPQIAPRASPAPWCKPRPPRATPADSLHTRVLLAQTKQATQKGTAAFISFFWGGGMGSREGSRGGFAHFCPFFPHFHHRPLGGEGTSREEGGGGTLVGADLALRGGRSFPHPLPQRPPTVCAPKSAFFSPKVVTKEKKKREKNKCLKNRQSAPKRDGGRGREGSPQSVLGWPRSLGGQTPPWGSLKWREVSSKVSPSVCVCGGGGVPKSPYGEPQKDGEVLKCPLRRVPQMGGGGPNGPKVSVSGRGGTPKVSSQRGPPNAEIPKRPFGDPQKKGGGDSQGPLQWGGSRNYGLSPVKASPKCPQ